MFYDSSFVFPWFFTATAYRSEGFLGSLSHTNASPAVATHTFYISGSCECNFFRNTFPWQLLSPYVLEVPNFCVVKFSCCNIFVGSTSYENISTRKFFERKFHITKISRFTVFTHVHISWLWKSEDRKAEAQKLTWQRLLCCWKHSTSGGTFGQAWASSWNTDYQCILVQC